MKSEATEASAENESRCLLPTCTGGEDDQPWRSGRQPTEFIAGCMATWHVYENHREIWIQAIGDRAPVDPDPRRPEVFQKLCEQPATRW